MVNEEFSIVALAPDPAADSLWFEDLDASTLRVWLQIVNYGVKNTNASLPVSLYGVNPPPATLPDASYIMTKPVGVNIAPGDTLRMYFDVPWAQATMYLSARIQDDGAKFPADGSFLDCNNGNNAIGGLRDIWAHDDRASTIIETPVRIDVLTNDYSIAASCTPIPDIITQPKHGTLIPVNDSIQYIPNAGFTGCDTVTYEINCNGSTSTANIHIMVYDKPDNVSEADCYVDPTGFVWDIKQDFISALSDISTYVSPVAGDLDGDGIPEILVAKFESDAGDTRLYNGIYIYWGNDRSNPTLVNIQSSYFSAYGFSIARIKMPDNTYKPVIVTVCKTDGLLYAYDPDPMKTTEMASRIWKSNHSITGHGTQTACSIGFVDFDGDGLVEIYVGNEIFDAATGNLLIEDTGSSNKGFSNLYNYKHCFPFATDVTGDGKPEYLAGTEVYSVNISDRTDYTKNDMTLIASIPSVLITGALYMKDGATTVADINLDGRLDIVVTAALNATTYGLMAWDVQTESVIAKGYGTTTGYQNSIPFIGNVDNNPDLEIMMVSTNKINGFRWDGNQTFNKVYDYSVADASGGTGISLFDFNQDGIMELVYRDESNLRILKANPAVFPATGTFSNVNTTAIAATSGTSVEHPIVVDADNDGHAEIVTVGGTAPLSIQGTMRIYKSGNEQGWAPARKVWNQYAYNSVNINDDLTVPEYQLNPATAFSGNDGITGTADDVRPYNNFLQQQTMLDGSGMPLWITPDGIFDEAQSYASRTGDSITLHACITNRGDAALGEPVYVTVYRDNASPANKIRTDSIDGLVLAGSTRCLTVGIPADTVYKYLPFVRLVVRLNDNGKADGYPAQPECVTDDSVTVVINPALSLMMKKRATLLGERNSGTYPNPVSVLYGEDIEYKITAVNANLSSGNIIVTDTLPLYLDFNGGASPGLDAGFPDSSNPAVGNILRWTVGLNSYATQEISYKASPAPGVSASQPMFVNRAWITASDTLNIVTDSATYHQGAGVSIITFSAIAGGQLFNATPQAVDYRTSPRAGIVVAPDDGYRFTGWSHDGYYSLRGDDVPANSGIMSYDTLTVYGNVELKANFELIDYSIHYYMNGCENPSANPALYTIETGNIVLEPPYKVGDVFVGWTGSNGEEPQMTVNIPKGSTGELVFYANFLVSGREKATEEVIAGDKIWSSGNTLYVTVSTPGSVIRIYLMDGILQKHHTAISLGTVKIKLPGGIYVVTVNNGVGRKVKIE
jgi:uncharacterized repeat protein (TIGR02543 family)